jgi:hypothetical protein
MNSMKKVDYLSTQYKGFDIDVAHDDCPINPFEEWDCEFPLMYYYDRHYTDYSKGDIDDFLVGFLSYNQLVYHQKRVSELIDFDIEWYKIHGYTSSEIIDSLRDALHEYITDSISNREKFCLEFGIKHYSGTSRGYSQGDWADVFICWTPEFEKTTGLKYEDVTDEMLEGTFETYSAWAWGDVYDIRVEKIDFYVGEYFGEKHVEDGIEEAKSEIDSYLKRKNKELQDKVKELIKNKVPFSNREEIVKSFKLSNHLAI